VAGGSADHGLGLLVDWPSQPVKPLARLYTAIGWLLDQRRLRNRSCARDGDRYVPEKLRFLRELIFVFERKVVCAEGHAKKQCRGYSWLIGAPRPRVVVPAATASLAVELALTAGRGNYCRRLLAYVRKA